MGDVGNVTLHNSSGVVFFLGVTHPLGGSSFSGPDKVKTATYE